MMYRLLAAKCGSLGAFLLLAIAVILSGCDTGGEALTPGGVTADGGAPTNASLTVDLKKALARSSGVAQVKVYALSLRGAELAQQTVDPHQSAVFADLPAGSVQIRAVALDARGEVLGFSDVPAAIPSDKKVEAGTLTQTKTMPSPATPGAPFLVFTGLPASYQAKTKYTIEVSAFNQQGLLDTEANGVVSLSSSGLRAVVPTASAPLSQGRVSFTGVSFAQGSNGTVTFTASGAGQASAISPTLPVRSN